MWVTLTVYDGPGADDGTYFFNYFQVEKPEIAGIYESFSCFLEYQRERTTVPNDEVNVINYYGDDTFKQG